MIKTRPNWEWKIPHSVLDRWMMRFSSYENRELKVKLGWVGARERKKSEFFVTIISSKGNFFNICVKNVLCIEKTFRIYIRLDIKKHYFMHFCCLFLKSSKAFSVFLRWNEKHFSSFLKGFQSPKLVSDMKVRL